MSHTSIQTKITLSSLIVILGLSFWGVSAKADDGSALAMTNIATESVVTPGDLYGYILTVSNNSDGILSNIAVSDTLPQNVSYVFSLGDGTYDPASGMWSVDGLLPNEQDTMYIFVQAANNVTSTIADSATATADGTAAVTASSVLGVSGVEGVSTTPDQNISSGDPYNPGTIGFDPGQLGD